MSFFRSFFTASLLVGAGLALSACAQNSNTLPQPSLGSASPDTSPPACKGQKTQKQYATLTDKLKTQGGAFCIPAFGGFGGTLDYPDISKPVDLTLTSSIKNYYHQPVLGPGKPMFYLQFAISGATSFGTKLKTGGGLTGSKIVSGKPYTFYGEAVIDSQQIKLGPCYATATAGKYGGVIGGLGTLVESRSVPAATTGVFEVYSGEQTSTQC
jgi:hypothetical protein